MARLSVMTIALVVVLGTLVAFPIATTGAETATHRPTGTMGQPAGTTPGPAAALQNGSIDQQFVIEVYTNGSARWQVRDRRALGNESERQQFRTFEKRFENQDTNVYTQFRGRAGNLTRSATNATGRPMNAIGFNRSARVSTGSDETARTGIVEMSFLWTNFTNTEDGLAVDDVFGNISIDGNQSLTVGTGPGLAIQSDTVEPSPDFVRNTSENSSQAVAWIGPRSFIPSHPHIGLVRQASSGTSPLLPPGGTAVGLGALVVLAVAAVLVQWFRTGESEGEPTGRVSADGNGADGPPGGVEGSTADPSPTEPTPAEPTRPTPPPGLDDEALRSDEGRIRELLLENGGRMRQARIVEETGWSKAKVSSLLTEMAEADRLSKLRLGRENVISLAGYEPEGVGSPPENGGPKRND